MKPPAQRLLATLSAGLVIFVVSEEVFWAFFRPTDTPWGLAQTWLLYCVATYLILWGLSAFKVASKARLFLVAALFGWLVEGLFVQTMYELLPFSISFTGLAWHALITVAAVFALGEYLLVDGTSKQCIGWAAALGAFWGWWAVSWAFEPGVTIPDPAGFARDCTILTLLLGVGFVGFNKVRPREFTPSRVEVGIVGVILGVFFFFDVVTSPLVLVVWLPLVGATLGLLHKTTPPADQSPSLYLSHWSARAAETPCTRVLVLVLVPVVATTIYTALVATGLIFPYNVALYFVTTPLGFVAFGGAAIQAWRRRGTPGSHDTRVTRMLPRSDPAPESESHLDKDRPRALSDKELW